VNLREEIGKAGNGEYNWDMIDGWEDLEYVPASGLLGSCVVLTMRRNHPDVQEKIKRVIKQGHIDPEDFKGVSGLLLL
jgi:serine/threonine-protein kinase ATR